VRACQDHPMRFRSLLLGALCALTLHPARAAVAAESPSPDPATVLSGGLTVDGKQIPLPDGEWRLTGRAVFSPPTLDKPGAVTSLSLVRVRGQSVDGAALIQVASPGADPLWGKAPACERADLPLARVRYASDHDGSCAWVSLVGTADRDALDPAWVQTLGEAERQGWLLPERWATASFRVTDPHDALQVRYAFDGGAENGEGAGRAPLAPDAEWVEAAWDQVERGFRNRLDGPRPLPNWTATPSTDAAPIEKAEGGGLGRTVWKTITFRGIVTTLDFSSNYVVIGDAAAAAGLSAFAFVIGPFVYIGHELAWERFGGPVVRSVELPGLGADKPGAL
jgi:uncharacterized membrane protein